MKCLLTALAVLAAANPVLAAVTIQGAGATFPYPIYAQWAGDYEKLTGVKVNYQSIGSGGGIKAIMAGTVDFGASDEPQKTDILEKNGLVQFPMIIGGVVPVIHVEGVGAGELTLSGELLADIYLGKITKWNAEPIRKLNPAAKLPDADINVVARADGSGTTWLFTTYLSEVSGEFKEKVGAGKSVQWPVGSAAKGNEGVAASVRQTRGGIGYVEYTYARQNKMSYCKMVNRAGKTVEPTPQTFGAAAATADWKNSPAFYVVLVNQAGEQSWPIAGASFILVNRTLKNAETGRAMLSFFDWCFKHGDRTAEKLDYVPVPDKVVKLVEETWAQQIRVNDEAAWPIQKAE
jgi:phosphate transport system substrate-binding protein